MIRLIQCKKCKPRIKVSGKKPKNNMLTILPKQVDPDHFKHTCKEKDNE